MRACWPSQPFPRRPRAFCCHCCRLCSGSGESGEGAPNPLMEALRGQACGGGGGGQGLGLLPPRPVGAARLLPSASRIWLGQGLKLRTGRWGQGWRCPRLLIFTCSFSSKSLPGVTDCEEEHACALRASEGSPAGNREGLQRSAPGEGPVPGQQLAA